jgi:hypothetical protein
MDSEGKFGFVNLSSGNFYLNSSFLEFKSYTTEAFDVVDGEPTSQLPEIILRPDDLALSEVTVVAHKPFVERRTDRMIINVEHSIPASGANVLEVLERAPGIVVSATDAIAIRRRPGGAMEEKQPPAAGG